ncbi:hypothetical protein AB0P15_29060 [Streptomyces sp. NPDC087917]|uniref:hypothetical protein n=1 Tax=Streptomyces sp. NPDC087917 TaxID=3155060 RepID=UPI0034218314
MLITTADSARHRPRSATALGNLFLAGDWVHSDLNLATMEAADQTGKAAVNALLSAAGSRAAPCEILTLRHPAELDELHEVDTRLYAAGLPNAFDRPAPWNTARSGAGADLPTQGRPFTGSGRPETWSTP